MTPTGIVAVPGQPQIVVTRDFRAPRELLFRAHTDPELLVRWLGPRTVRMTVDRLDARDGGAWRYTHCQPDGKGKNAIVYGGGGMIGGAVARAFASEGATVHLAGRTAARPDAVATDIRAAGGAAVTATLDALDEMAVGAHADAVVASRGSLDISFNLISQGDVQGTPLAEMAYEDFERPVRTALRTTFLTSRAAARHMMGQRSGVILMFGGYGDPVPRVGGLQVAFGALEALRRGLACELGPYGIRVLTLQTGGITETLPQGFPGREAIIEGIEGIEGKTMLGRAATLADVGHVAAFAASDHARSMTATALNITTGSVVD